MKKNNERVDGRLELTGDKYSSIIVDTLGRIGGNDLDRKGVVRKLLDSFLFDVEMVGVERDGVNLIDAIKGTISTLEFIDKCLQDDALIALNSLLGHEIRLIIGRDLNNLKKLVSPYPQHPQQKGKNNASN